MVLTAPNISHMIFDEQYNGKYPAEVSVGDIIQDKLPINGHLMTYRMIVKGIDGKKLSCFVQSVEYEEEDNDDEYVHLKPFVTDDEYDIIHHGPPVSPTRYDDSTFFGRDSTGSRLYRRGQLYVDDIIKRAENKMYNETRSLRGHMVTYYKY